MISIELNFKDIEYLGLTKVWSVFATMAVDYLGCPEEVMPLYDNRYKKMLSAYCVTFSIQETSVIMTNAYKQVLKIFLFSVLLQ